MGPVKDVLCSSGQSRCEQTPACLGSRIVRHGINWEQTMMPVFGMILKMGINTEEMKQQKIKFSSSPK